MISITHCILEVDINGKDADGRTALMRAAIGNHVDVVPLSFSNRPQTRLNAFALGFSHTSYHQGFPMHKTFTGFASNFSIKMLFSWRQNQCQPIRIACHGFSCDIANQKYTPNSSLLPISQKAYMRTLKSMDIQFFRLITL